MGDTVTGIEHDTGGTTTGVQTQHGLNGDVECGSIERFKHDLSHLLPVGFGVEGSLREKDGVFLWSNTEFIVKRVVPNLFHIIPVGDDTVLDGVLQCEDTSL